MKTWYFVTALLLCTAACQKGQQTAPLPSVKKSAVKPQKDFAQAANPENPFDEVGKIHNLGLDALINYMETTRDTTRYGRSVFLAKFFKELYNIHAKPEQSLKLEMAIKKDFKDVLFSQRISNRSKVFLKEVSAILERIKTLEDYSSYKEAFVTLEKKIYLEKLPEKEKEILLSTASIFRYSGLFWMEFYKNNPQAETWGLLRKLAGVIVGIAADATSFFYYAFVDSSYYERLESTIDMSYVCGYGTGWY